MNSPISIAALLAGAAFTSPALAQTQPAAAPPQPQPSSATQPVQVPVTTQDILDAESGDTSDEVVVVGSKPRGSVIGDIPPENTLDSRDVRATGATSITELLDALAPQIGSARGRGGEQPVLLLNGQRISSFRELRDIPTEAIERVDILPEEVALKYGYSANQKVVNIVLRQRFRSTTAQLGLSTATDGGYTSATGDLTRLMIQKNGRTTFNLHATGNGMLTEAERNIRLEEDPTNGATAEQELAARSLLGTKRDLRAGATINRKIFGDVSATINPEVEHTDGRSLIGLSNDALRQALGRKTTADSAHLGGALNWDKWDWRWSVTGNADYEHDTTRTDADQGNQRAHEDRSSADFMATANGNLFALPAGNATTTIKLGGSTSHLSSASTSNPLATSLGRTTGSAAINVDLPISRRGHDFSALGNFTLNANAEVEQLSDFGTLTTLGAGANFSPVNRLNFIASWTREEGAPTIQQLGDPQLITPNTRIFDFTTGQTALVTSVTGGNPNLKSDRRNVVKLSTNWQPSEKLDLRLRADFVHQTIARPISNITVTQQIEAAFPDRFTRVPCSESDDPLCDPAQGELVRVDLRPVNFDRSTRDTLRIGFDFSKPLKSHRPSQAVMDQMRQQLRAQFGFAGGRPGSGAPTAPGQPANNATPPAGAPPAGGQTRADNGGPPAGGPPGGGFGRGGRGGGGFGGFGRGGGSRGRIQFSLTDTVTLKDKVSIAPGLPEIDYLHGGAAGESGGTPRHSVEAQLGYFNNGLGARIGANWQSGTTVTSITGDNLHFSPLATFDLRLFANPGDIPDLVVKHSWLRGTQVRLEVKNVFNTRQNVRDAAGGVPLSYQPGLLDPLGRTVMISIRKLFLPSPSFFRRQFEQRQQQQQQSGTTTR